MLLGSLAFLKSAQGLLEDLGSVHCIYSPRPLQADKVVQLYETMLTRHTVMVVGPTGGGKSVVINALAQAQTRYYRSLILWLMHEY